MKRRTFVVVLIVLFPGWVFIPASAQIATKPAAPAGGNNSTAHLQANFFDNFEDGVADGWAPQTPSRWEVVADQGDFSYHLWNPHPTGDEYAVIAGRTFSNFDMTVQLRSGDGAARNVFILFDMQTYPNGYYLQLGEAATILYLTTGGPGTGFEIARNDGYKLNDNQYHTIRIVRQDNNIKVYGNGAQILNLNNGVYLSGQIAIGSFKGTAYFDDVNIIEAGGPPDFVADRVYLRTGINSGVEVDNPVAGQLYYVHFNWRNIGPAGPSVYRVDIKLNGSVLCVDNLNDGGFSSSINWCTNPVTWPAGINTIEGVLDVNNVVVEANENNNAVSRTYPGTEPPELVADRIYLRTGPNNSGDEVNNPVAGQSYYLYFDWRNTGGQANNFLQQLKLNNAVVCGFNTSSIPANSSQTSWCDAPISWPPCTNAPTVIEGALDVSNVISEPNENNNVVSREFRCSQPNLVPTALAFSPASVNAGSSLNLSGSVTNNGTGSTVNAFRVSFYLSTNPTAPDVNLLVHSFIMPALGAGQSNNFTQTGTVPANTAPGSYYVWVRVDADNAIFESSETDNQLRTNTLLTVISTPGIKPTGPASQPIGTEFGIDVMVTDVTNLFGVGFELNYNSTYLSPVVGSPTVGDFLGNDVVFVATPGTGKISFGISRKAGQLGSTGSGIVARARFISLPSTPPNTQVVFTITGITANDPNGAPIPLTPSSHTMVLTGCTVWPGDTNNDRIVNQADVLPLGLHWSRIGPARPNASLAWIGQPATPWSPEAATYADANGNGVVNQADVLPVGLNWGRTHTFIPAAPLAKTHPASSATLLPEINPAPALDQEFFIRMNLAQATDLFGLAFELLYDRPDMLQILSVEPDESFGANVVFYSKADNAAGKVAIGISRKAGQESVYGSASAVRIKAKFSANARLGETIAFSLANVSANDSNGRPIAIYAQTSRLTIGATAAENAAELVADYRLHQNSPNPFNPETLIRYEIPEAGPVWLKVYNFTGQEVRTLVNSFQQSGSHQITWDGRDAHGRDLPSGTYLYRLQSGAFSETRKMLLLR